MGGPLKRGKWAWFCGFLIDFLLEAFLNLAKDCDGSRQKIIDKTVTIEHVNYVIFYLSELI